MAIIVPETCPECGCKNVPGGYRDDVGGWHLDGLYYPHEAVVCRVMVLARIEQSERRRDSDMYLELVEK